MTCRPTVEPLESRLNPRAFAYHVSDFPSDVMYTHGFERYAAAIHAPEAWAVKHSVSIPIAIIDTGVDFREPDLAPNQYVNAGEIPGNGLDDDGNGYVDDVSGWDFVHGDNSPSPDNFHGQQVAGIIGAKGNDGYGYAGVVWDVKLVALKVFDVYGFARERDILDAIHYVVDNGIKLVNCSWGSNFPSRKIKLALQWAGDNGVTFVFAAGNSAGNNDRGFNRDFPVAYGLPNVIAVAAMDYSKPRLAYFSNWGRKTVDLAAPGMSIYGVGGLMSGTSFACPMVTGAVAYVVDAHPDWTPAQVKDFLRRCVDVLPSLADKVLSGGRLNLYLVVSALE